MGLAALCVDGLSVLINRSKPRVSAGLYIIADLAYLFSGEFSVLTVALDDLCAPDDPTALTGLSADPSENFLSFLSTYWV